MQERAGMAEVKVGLFVVVAVLLFVVGALWIAGARIFDSGLVPYQVLLKNSQGVRKGDRVRFAGVGIGRIRSIDLQPGTEWPVVVHVALDRQLPVREDATARFATTNMLGSSFLEIDPGSPQALPLPPGGRIYGGEIQGLTDALARLDQISGKAFELLGRTDTILGEVNRHLGPILQQLRGFLTDENAEAFGALLADARITLEELRPEVVGLAGRLNALADRLEGQMDELPALTGGAADLIAGLQKAVGPEGERLALLLESAGESLDGAAAILQILSGRRGDLDATLADFRDTAANLKALSQTLKERPFSLVRIKPEPERRPGDGGSR